MNYFRWLIYLMLWFATGSALAESPVFSKVTQGRALSFPRDFGAHPDFKTEWWYATGWLQTPDGKPLGFQVTFFRSATEHDTKNTSRFSPRQLIIAHAALSDTAIGKLHHDQKIARAGFGRAFADEATTRLKLDSWTMQRNSGGQYQLQIPARDFMLSLTLQPTQAVMLQGDNGYSRKGALAEQASYYYSEPQLAVSGTVTRQGKSVKVTGNAWLDHEWSSTVLDKNAVGWDWVGLNLADGGALMAFQIRSAEGKPVWQHAALRDAKGHTQSIDASRIRFMPLKTWRSPRTGASYPTSLQITINDVRWEVVPLQNDQELDSRLSTGSVYWEGAVTVLRNGQPAGRGYLEMTGYLKALKL